MNKDNIYTMTIKMAQGGTEYIDDNAESSKSAVGHMWYTLSKNGEQTDSFGFGPQKYGLTDLFGMYTDGKVLTKDDEHYQATYATYEVRITKEQYEKLQDFGEDENLEANNFNDHYKVASNSCVDYVWRAMEFAGVNPDKFDGDMFPKNNRDDVNAHLYQAINGTSISKEEQALEKTATDGSFTAMYGSKGSDDLTSTKTTEVVYGGKGDDNLKGVVGHADKLRGGTGYDTYTVQNKDSIKDTDGKGRIFFDATLLSGVKHMVSKGVYADDMFTYTEVEQDLVIAQKADPSKSVTIENWHSQKKGLGIELSDDDVLEEKLDPTSQGMNTLPEDLVVANENIVEFTQDKEPFDMDAKVQEILAQVLPHTYAPQTQDSYDNDMGM